MTRLLVAIALAALFAGVVSAQTAPVAPDPALEGVIALSPAEREAALNAASDRRLDALDGTGSGRQIHGEMGFEVGTGGTRALFGSTVVPLGENGTAAFSFYTGRSNWGRWR